MISTSLFAFAVHAIAWSATVSGQGTNATCISGEFDWMTNTLGQSPCLVSSFLLTPCYPETSSYWVYPLGPGQHYNTIANDAFSATACVCNTVYYSTISACATCQGQGLFVPLWSEFAFYCSTTAIMGYPENIPPRTGVPAWAYLDVRTTDEFDSLTAEALAKEGLAESTAPSASGPTSSLNAPPAASESALTTGAPQPPNGNKGDDKDAPSSKKSTDIAPIVGGAVGGLVGAIAIGLVLFFWLRHKRNATRHTPTGSVDLTASEYGQYTDKPIDLDQGAPATSIDYSLPISPPAPSSPKIYDPDDPSTFPDSFTPQYPVANPYQPPSTGVISPAAYKGVPEL